MGRVRLACRVCIRPAVLHTPGAAAAAQEGPSTSLGRMLVTLHSLQGALSPCPIPVHVILSHKHRNGTEQEWHRSRAAAWRCRGWHRYQPSGSAPDPPASGPPTHTSTAGAADSGHPAAAAQAMPAPHAVGGVPGSSRLSGAEQWQSGKCLWWAKAHASCNTPPHKHTQLSK